MYEVRPWHQTNSHTQFLQTALTKTLGTDWAQAGHTTVFELSASQCRGVRIGGFAPAVESDALQIASVK
jgi:hypothetical protein